MCLWVTAEWSEESCRGPPPFMGMWPRVSVHVSSLIFLFISEGTTWIDYQRNYTSKSFVSGSTNFFARLSAWKSVFISWQLCFGCRITFVYRMLFIFSLGQVMLSSTGAHRLKLWPRKWYERHSSIIFLETIFHWPKKYMQRRFLQSVFFRNTRSNSISLDRWFSYVLITPHVTHISRVLLTLFVCFINLPEKYQII